MELNLYSIYSVSVAVSHVLFAVILLRLYQLVKRAKLCKDTWALRVGMVLAVTGTLTIAAIPITSNDLQTLSREAQFWSVARTVGLIVLLFVMFRTLIHPPKNLDKDSEWDGVERRKRLTGSDFFKDKGSTGERPTRPSELI